MGSAGPHLLTFQDKPEMQIFRNLLSCAKLAIDSDIFERPGELKQNKKGYREFIGPYNYECQIVA